MQLEPRFTGTLPVFVTPIPRYRNEMAAGRFAPQLGGHRAAIHSRKPEVAQHDLRLETARGCQPLRSGEGHLDVVPGQLQQLAQALSRVAIVFHHQDPPRLRLCRVPTGSPGR